MSRDDDSFFGVAAGVLVMMFAIGAGIAAVKSCEDPPPCSDYSYKISRVPFTNNIAECTRWPDMEMDIDKGILSGTLVNCTCEDNGR